MIGDELIVIPPEKAEIGGSTVRRVDTLRTSADTDADLSSAWLKADAINSAHTRRIYQRTAARFITALAGQGVDLRSANLEHVQAAIEVLAKTKDGKEAKPATLNTYVAAVKSFLNFAHAVGYTQFNAAPLIKIRQAPRRLAQKLLGEADLTLLIRAAKTPRQGTMLRVAYYGGLRVSELTSLIWTQVTDA